MFLAVSHWFSRWPQSYCCPKSWWSYILGSAGPDRSHDPAADPDQVNIVGMGQFKAQDLILCSSWVGWPFSCPIPTWLGPVHPCPCHQCRIYSFSTCQLHVVANKGQGQLPNAHVNTGATLQKPVRTQGQLRVARSSDINLASGGSSDHQHSHDLWC